MNFGEIRQQAIMYSYIAEIEAIKASIEGMKAENITRENDGYALAFGYSAFQEASEDLNDIVLRLRNHYKIINHK